MKVTLAAIILFCFVRLQAQLPEDWGAFYQKVNVSAFQGKHFKVTAAIRAECIDSAAGAELWVRIDKTDKTMGFFYNMMDKPIRTSSWKTFTIQGKINKNSQFMSLGGLYQHKGLFFFDDFHLTIETGKGKWEEIVLPDAGFENSGDSAKTWSFLQERPFFHCSVTQKSSFEGQSAFEVDGKQFVNSNSYDNNDTAGRHIWANGINIYYETYGAGFPLLLLHGNSESIASFDKQIQEMAKYYKIIAVDTRGQGRSSEDGKEYTYELFAADLNALLDSLHLTNVNILGWSDGGITGLIMAMKYSDKVSKLAVMGANIFSNNDAINKDVFRSVRKDLDQIRGDTSYSARNQRRLIELMLTQPNLKFSNLDSIHCPVLVMAGEMDAVKKNHTVQIAGHIPHSKLVIFSKGTHNEPKDNPALFNQTVLDFLSSSTF